MSSSSPLLFFLRLQPRINLLVQQQPKLLRNFRQSLFEFFFVHFFSPVPRGHRSWDGGA